MLAGEVKMDPTSGIRGLKQIIRCLTINRIGSRQSEITGEIEDADETFERHSRHFLNRCFPGWMKK